MTYPKPFREIWAELVKLNAVVDVKDQDAVDEFDNMTPEQQVRFLVNHIKMISRKYDKAMSYFDRAVVG